MQPEENVDLANGLHLRVLVRDDAALLVEATREEQDPALWGPRPAGPYSLRDAQAALSAWDPAAQAVRATTPWAHRSLGIPRVWLEINPGNEPSLRVARRAGYRFEQRLPRHCRDWACEDADKDSWHDCLIWTYGSPGE